MRGKRAVKGAAPATARVRRPPPYIRCLDRSGRIAVWQIDGAYVRKNIDKEFTDFGHHYSFDAIPRNEIWLDVEKGTGEQQAIIRHAATERRLMALGMDYESARTLAIAGARRTRVMADGGEAAGSEWGWA